MYTACSLATSSILAVCSIMERNDDDRPNGSNSARVCNPPFALSVCGRAANIQRGAPTSMRKPNDAYRRDDRPDQKAGDRPAEIGHSLPDARYGLPAPMLARVHNIPFYCDMTVWKQGE